MGHPAFNYEELPIPERLQLVDEIWASIAQEAYARAESLPLTGTRRTELDRRIANADRIPRRVSPGDSSGSVVQTRRTRRTPPRFVFRLAAIEELRAPRDWYKTQRAGLGAELGQVVAGTLERVCESCTFAFY